MRKGLILLLAFASIQSYCQVTLNPGESYTFEFNAFTYNGTVPAPPNTRIFFTSSGGGGPGSIRVEAFENSVSEPPILDTTFFTSPIPLGGTRWHDLQGVVRFTSINTTFTLNSLTAQVRLPNQDSNPYHDEYAQTVTPQPDTGGLPTLSVQDVVVAEPTNGTVNAVFPVGLSTAYTQAVTVAYSTTNGTATAGSDYNAVSGTLVFEPGETNKSISVTVLADVISEGNENFRVNLSSPTNAVLAGSQGTCTINELRVTSLAFHVDVSFNSVNQARYRIEWSEDASNWSPVHGAENVLGTGNTVTITHTNAACDPSRLYRVLLLE
jgi:hypothetical protein